jgi:hypothetical protein
MQKQWKQLAPYLTPYFEEREVIAMSTPTTTDALLSQIRSAENTLIAALEIERDIDTYSPEELERTIRMLQEARDSLNAMADRHALEGTRSKH